MIKEPPEDKGPTRSARHGVETVVLSNVYSDNNKGGAAITQMTGRFARCLVPGARLVLITVSSGDPGQDATQDQNLTDEETCVRIPPLLKATGGVRTVVALVRGAAALLFPRILKGREGGLSEIARARVVISKGGYLFGYRSGTRSILGLLSTSFPLLYASRLGVPTVAYSSSVGPFSGRVHRWTTGLILRRLTVVMVRDSDSERRAIELGVVRSGLVLMPDCVFRWRPDIDGPSDLRTHSSRLAIVLRDVQPLRKFLPALERVILRSSEQSIFSSFLVVVQSLEDRLITRQFVDRLQELGLNAAMADASLDPPSALLKTYGESAVTVSARLHGAIFSILAGTPAIALSADPSKAEGVMTEVGLGDWVLPLDAARTEDLFDRLVQATQPSVSAKVRSLVELAAERVETAEFQARSMLDSISP